MISKGKSMYVVQKTFRQSWLPVGDSQPPCAQAGWHVYYNAPHKHAPWIDSLSQPLFSFLQENGVQVGMEFFHDNLPLDRMLAGKPVEWNLSAPNFSNFFYEVGGGIVDLFIKPYRGAKEDGAQSTYSPFTKA